MGSIKDQNLLRVGYNDNYAPSCFFNKKGPLAGYEVGMAYDLAWFLGMGRIEFIPITRGNLCGALNHGTCDILMLPATVISKRLDDMKFSDPYTVPCMAFVLKDERRWEFSSLGTVKKMEGLKVAALNNSDHFNYAKTLLPKATIVGLDSLEDFFQGNRAEAFITTAEGASTMTQLQLHPFYGVAKIGPKFVANHQIIYAYPMAIDRGDAFMAQLNYWPKMQESGVALPGKYNYWILGGNAQEETSWWSVIMDALHWVD